MTTSFLDAVRRLELASDYGFAVFAVGGSAQSPPPDLVVNGGIVGRRVLEDVTEVLCVGGDSEARAWTNAEELCGVGAQVAVCMVAGGNGGGLKLNRAARVVEVLRHRLNPTRIGILQADTEVIRSLGFRGDRRGAEERSMRLVENGDLEGAGFASFEIDESSSSRIRWITGLLDRCVDLAPNLPALCKSRKMLTGKVEPATVYEMSGRIRSELIVAERSSRVHDLRALYVAELSVKVLHNLLDVEAAGASEPFDRETGWWIVRAALDNLDDARERDRWLDVLFPVLRSLWT